MRLRRCFHKRRCNLHSHGTFRVHLIRGSLEFRAWQDRKHVAAELKAIYQAPTVEADEHALAEFAASDWGKKYPNIAPMWRRVVRNVKAPRFVM